MKTSPVVRADTKLSGSPPFVYVDVRFRSKRELDDLIDALTELRDGKGQDFDQVHLQDTHLSKGGRGPLSAMEVNFHRPGKKRDSQEHAAMREGAKMAKAFRRKRAI